MAFCQVFMILICRGCVVWEGGVSYVVLAFRRGLGKFW